MSHASLMRLQVPSFHALDVKLRFKPLAPSSQGSERVPLGWTHGEPPAFSPRFLPPWVAAHKQQGPDASFDAALRQPLMLCLFAGDVNSGGIPQTGDNAHHLGVRRVV